MEPSRAQAADLTREIAEFIRKPPRELAAQLDPTGVALFLQAVDTAALERELSRRQALNVVAEYKETLSEKIEQEPTEADLYELALAELAEGRYLEATEAARRCAALAEQNIAAHPGAPSPHRESALNAYLLLRDAYQAAGRRDEALAALKAGAALIEREREPILWAEYHEEIARLYLQRAEVELAAEVISEIIGIREELEPESVPLAKSLLLWCDQLQQQARPSDIAGVAARAERIFSSQTPPLFPAMVSALTWRARALETQGFFSEAEPLFRRALAIDERSHGPEHPNVAIRLNNLAELLRETNRLAEAEPLCRRALAIDEQSYGPDHPEVARDLNNLALLLRATNRLSEAEPLYRRALGILFRFQRDTGHVHPHFDTASANYASLLSTTGLSEPEIDARIEDVKRRALSD